jgi:hypothetical protein
VAGKEIAVKKYVVKLSAEERERLEAMTCAGKHPAQLLTKARILLKADASEAGEGWSDSTISEALDNQHQQYRPPPPSPGRGRARGGAEAQTQSELRPAAHFRWRDGGEIDRPDVLAGSRGVRALEPAPARGEGRRIEHRREGQRQHNREGFKKNILKPHRQRQWVIPPDANAGFVAAMEDVLETYQNPRDPDRPLVCLDETSKQLILETRAPIPAKPGRAARHDYEYERNGVANLFMMFAPLEGWRQVKVTDRHAAVDYAQVLKELSDVHFPDAAQITLVQDNLSTHTAASLYAAFPAVEARRLALCGLPCRRSAPPRKAVRMALYAETWKLARHGRIRTRRPVEPMSEPAHSRQADPPTRGRGLAGPSQQTSCKGRLAIHHRRRPRETQEALPHILNDSGD